NGAVVGSLLQASTFQLEDLGVRNPAEAGGAPDHRVEHGLEIHRRGADDPQNLGRGRLLLQRLGQRAACRLLPFQALPQALLQIPDLGPFVLGRLASERSLGPCFRLRGLCTTTLQTALASHGAVIDDRLGESSRVSKPRRSWLGGLCGAPGTLPRWAGGRLLAGIALGGRVGREEVTIKLDSTTASSSDRRENARVGHALRQLFENF